MYTHMRIGDALTLGDYIYTYTLLAHIAYLSIESIFSAKVFSSCNACNTSLVSDCTISSRTTLWQMV